MAQASRRRACDADVRASAGDADRGVVVAVTGDTAASVRAGRTWSPCKASASCALSESSSARSRRRNSAST
eukprot:5457630-Pleurochrysis_carterae.AAC.1